LPEPEWRESGYEAPRSHVEAELCRIWGEVLGIERVGIQDNFFDLGGDSIGMVSLLSRLQGLTSEKLTLALLLDRPSVRDFAAYMSALPESRTSFGRG